MPAAATSQAVVPQAVPASPVRLRDDPPVRDRPPVRRFCSREEYLEGEEGAYERSQYLDGEAIPMAGVALEHALISSRFATLYGNLAPPRGWSMIMPCLKVRVPARTARYAYPDSGLMPLPPRMEPPVRPGGRRTVLLNPLVLTEVLSDSTAADDRGWKLDGYRRIASLTDYLVVDPTEVLVEHHHRPAGGTWAETVLTDRSALITLSAGGVLRLEEIYSVLDGLDGDDAAGDADAG